MNNKIVSLPMELHDDNSFKIQYDTPGFPSYIRYGALSMYPDRRTSVHWNNEVELVFLVSGEMSYNVNGQIIPLKKYEGLFVNAKQIHYCFCDANQDCEYYVFLISPAILKIVETFRKELLETILDNKNLPFLTLRRSVLWQLNILELLEKISQMKQTPAYELKVLSTFAEIWAIIYEHIVESDTSSVPADPDISIVKKMIRFIHTNFQTHITLDNIAMAGAVGQSKCCRLFSQYFKVTPIAYLNLFRLEQSTKLLRETSLPITEIALATGFNDIGYFSKQFRKWANQSPREYRVSTQNLIKSEI